MLPNPSSRGRARGIVAAALCVTVLALAGCSHRKLAQSGPVALYKQAKHQLDDYNYDGAIKLYERLTAVYPFSSQAHQAQLDLIYAYYRADETDSAADAIKTFIQQNPANPRVDYAYYMKGLIYFPKQANPVERLFGAHLSQRPPHNVRKSFTAFRTVVTQYPHSAYAFDARKRMIYLRDRLASYNADVARYYLTRGAYVAAVRRTDLILENYQGAPATKDALAIMIVSYDRLGLKPLAAQARRVYAANFHGEVTQVAAAVQQHWWHFW